MTCVRGLDKRIHITRRRRRFSSPILTQHENHYICVFLLMKTASSESSLLERFGGAPLITESCHAVCREIYADDRMRKLYREVDMIKQREQLIQILMVLFLGSRNVTRLRNHFVKMNKDSLLKGNRWHFDLFLRYLDMEWQRLGVHLAHRHKAVGLLMQVFGVCFRKQPLLRGLVEVTRTCEFRRFYICCVCTSVDGMMKHRLP